MQQHKFSCSIGLMLAWIALGEWFIVRAQAPVISEPPFSSFPRTVFPSPDEPKTDSLCQPPLIFDDLALSKKEAVLLETPVVNKPPRVQLFRMPAAFLINAPLGLDCDDDDLSDECGKSSGDDDASFIQINFSRHIPYLDMYRHGDPGGLGYYRLHSQMQIFDVGSSSLCLEMQAFTPMGSEVMNGPTTMIPALSCFQELYAGTALHAFIGGIPVDANSHWRDQLLSGYRCGFAVQQPIPVLPCKSAEQGLFLFVQTLGEYRSGPLADSKAVTWEVIPGVQWRVNPNCWMSLGVSRYSLLSCAWQF